MDVRDPAGVYLPMNLHTTPMDLETKPTWDLPQDRDATAWDRMADIVPRNYVCHFTEEAPRIDGKLDDDAWVEAPWSDPFVDIEGDRKPAPYYETRMAMRWDDECLYIAGQVEDHHVWCTLTEPNSPLFQEKNFEVFIDPDGDNHHYYELEINALNTIWELTLLKPYRDGGPVQSPTNIEGLRSAAHVEGTLNAPHDEDAYWSVEIAIPWRGLARYGAAPPEEGSQWRMNFSRVQWQHEIRGSVYHKKPHVPEENWVWSPQGAVDMHRPERWGFVQFTKEPPGTVAFRPDPTLEARDALMACYYAQKAHFKEQGRWANASSDLPDSLNQDIRVTPTGDGWLAEFFTIVEGRRHTLRVDQSSRLTVVPG